MSPDLTLGIDAAGGECARRGLDGGWGGDPLFEGLGGWGFQLVITQVIPEGSGPDKESSYTVRRWSETLGKVWSSGLLGFL